MVLNSGELSQGETKRVSIALELVAAPQVLILDEPTSGLDAQAALSIMELLRSFSRQGLTIICVIHQPRVEIFEALDNLLILDLGKAIYSGKALEAKRHFEARGYVFSPNLNPARSHHGYCVRETPASGGRSSRL